MRAQNDTRVPFYRARWCPDGAARWAYGEVRRTEREARRDLLKLIRPDQDGHAEVLGVLASDPEAARKAFVRNPDYGGGPHVLLRSNWRNEHPMFAGEWREILWLQLVRRRGAGWEDLSGTMDPKKVRGWGDIHRHFGGGTYRVFAFGDASGSLAYAQATLPGKPKPLVLSPSIEWPPPITKKSGTKPPRGAA